MLCSFFATLLGILPIRRGLQPATGVEKPPLLVNDVQLQGKLLHELFLPRTGLPTTAVAKAVPQPRGEALHRQVAMCQHARLPEVASNALEQVRGADPEDVQALENSNEMQTGTTDLTEPPTE